MVHRGLHGLTSHSKAFTSAGITDVFHHHGGLRPGNELVVGPENGILLNFILILKLLGRSVQEGARRTSKSVVFIANLPPPSAFVHRGAVLSSVVHITCRKFLVTVPATKTVQQPGRGVVVAQLFVVVIFQRVAFVFRRNKEVSVDGVLHKTFGACEVYAEFVLTTLGFR